MTAYFYGAQVHLLSSLIYISYSLLDVYKRQVLYNLVGNAIKYTQSGSIKVSAMEKDGYVYISVVDTGIGIPADKINTIFDSFEQITSSVLSLIHIYTTQPLWI